MRHPASSSSSAAAGGRVVLGVGGNTSKTTPCCSKVGLKRGPWTAEEDEVLGSYIRKEGEGRWRTLPKRAGLLRCGKSCRLRWMNYLRPSVKRGHIAPDEEDLILRLHRLLGNRWSLIAGRIPGRTDNEIKNYWNTHLSKKLISQGIDPRTHKPLLLNPNSSATASSSPSPTSHTPRNHPYSNNNNHHHLQSSSSSPRPPNYPLIRNPNALPTPIQPTDEDSPGGTRFFVGSQSENHHTNGYFDEGTGFSAATGVRNSGIANLRNLASSPTMGLRSSNTNIGLVGLYGEEGEGEEEEQEGDINRCCGGDDVFSSFLNSLINEDAFTVQHEVVLQQPNNNASVVVGGGGSSSTTTTTTTTNTCDALNISSSAAQAFGLNPSWEAAVMSSASAIPFRHRLYHGEAIIRFC